MTAEHLIELNNKHNSVELARLYELMKTYHQSGLSHTPSTRLAHWQHRPAKGWQTVKSAFGRGVAARVGRDVVDGQPISYWECGHPDKPTLLLLHGFGSCKENWTFLTRMLVEDYHLLVPDIFGFGDSFFRYGTDYSLEAQARRLLGWLSQRGSGPVVAVGNSMGGAIAAQMAAIDGDRVAGVCLMNTAGAPGTRLSQLELGLSEGENYLVPRNFAETQRLFDMAMHRQRVLGSAFSLLLSSDMTARQPVNHYLFGQLVDSLVPTWLSLPKVTVPCLILWGDRDQVLDPTSIAALQSQLPQAHTKVFNNVGHLPMLEAPLKTSSMLRWLANRVFRESEPGMEPLSDLAKV